MDKISLIVALIALRTNDYKNMYIIVVAPFPNMNSSNESPKFIECRSINFDILVFIEKIRTNTLYWYSNTLLLNFQHTRRLLLIVQ